MRKPDPMGSERPLGLSTGCNFLFLVIILLLLAALALWAWERNPPTTPAPVDTGNPSGPPPGNAS